VSKPTSWERWKKAQEAAVKAFKPITRTTTIHINECPDCWASRPQGNESAWAKGCKDCDLYDECGKATEEVYEAAMTKKEWEAMAKRHKEFMNPDYWQKKYGGGWKGA
jgi:hypothetical protein